MIEGDDGIVIIDTMESTDTAKEVLDEFREITKKPIVGIVLTHFHADHTNGIEVFLEDCKDQENVEIITHESFPKYLGQVRHWDIFWQNIKKPFNNYLQLRLWMLDPRSPTREQSDNLELRFPGKLWKMQELDWT